MSYLCEGIIQIAWTVLTRQVINSLTLSTKWMLGVSGFVRPAALCKYRTCVGQGTQTSSFTQM